jgi:hypothetical protein
MIINGGSRSNGAFFSKHLTNGEHNERVTLCELRNLAATNVPDLFREMQAVAMGTLCRNYFYHANINPREDEILTLQQWELAIDTLERHLGLEGHARFVVEHQKQGRTHRHVIWSRIDVRAMRAAVMTDNYARHEAAARELERIFGLAAVESVLGREASCTRPSRRPKSWESFRGQRSGIDPNAMKETLTRLYRECATGAEFAARLPEYGLHLVAGDRTEFCVLDKAGHLHSLARRLDGVTATALRAFLRNIPLS